MEDHDGKSDRDVVVGLTKEGNSLLKHNRLDEAVGRFKLALEHDPENAYALSGLGDAARKRGDFAAAREIRESRLIEENFSDIFLYHGFNPKTVPLIALADYVLLLVKKDVYCTGYLYTLVKALNEKDIQKKIVVVHSEARRLEDAASAFASLREELGGMLGQKPDVDFGGFFPVDAAYLAHASRKGLPCVKVFPESAFHGVIKYVNRALNGLETYIHERPFLYGLTALPQTGPA